MVGMKGCSNFQDVAWLIPFPRPAAWNVKLDIGFHQLELLSAVGRGFQRDHQWCGVVIPFPTGGWLAGQQFSATRLGFGEMNATIGEAVNLPVHLLSSSTRLRKWEHVSCDVPVDATLADLK